MVKKPSGNAWAAAIPPGMRALPQWVAHRSKKPEHPATGAAARVNDPRTWGTFEDARRAYERLLADPSSGVGFVFTDTSGLVFVDFDHVLAGGVLRPDLDPEVLALVEACLASTYCEFSPSGTGLHALFIGKLPEGAAHNRRWRANTPEEYGVEVYDRARYATVTGQRAQHGTGYVPLAAAPDTLARVVALVGQREAALVDPEAEEPERLEEVMEALTHLDPDMPRPDWIKVGMALKAGLGEAGRDLFVGWSREGSKHVEGEPDRLWESFRRSGVGLGSVIWMAEQNGWARDGKYTRPEDVFEPVPDEPGQEDDLLIRADTVKRVPIRWLWKYRIARGHLAVIAGDPKAGKTLMVESLAALRSRGLPLPGDAAGPETGPRRWVLLESEDDEGDTTAPRLYENGADMERVSIMNRAGKRLLLTNPEDLKRLEAAIRKLGDVEALVVSPIHNFVGGSAKLDMNKDQDARTALMPLVGLAKRLDIAVIGVHHMNKSTSAPSMYRLLGSIGIVGVARTILAVGRKDDLRYVTLVGSNNRDAPALAFDIEPSENDENIGVVKWTDAPVMDMDTDTLLAAPDPKAQAARTEGAVAWLVARLAAGPVPSAEVYEDGKAAGFSKRTLERARDKAGAEAVKLPGAGSGWAWKLAQVTETP